MIHLDSKQKGKPLTILVADDHSVVRGGIKQIISTRYEDAQYIECSNGEEVLQKLSSTSCDLVILDISMPGANGIDVLAEIRTTKPDLPVIILTIYKEESFAIRAFQVGATAYLEKISASDELLRAIEAVLAGRRYTSPTLADCLAGILSGTLPASKLATLSERENMILLLIAKGKSLKEIAGNLGISPKTITTYRSRVLEKLELDSNAALIQFAVKNGLIE